MSEELLDLDWPTDDPENLLTDFDIDKWLETGNTDSPTITNSCNTTTDISSNTNTNSNNNSNNIPTLPNLPSLEPLNQSHVLVSKHAIPLSQSHKTNQSRGFFKQNSIDHNNKPKLQCQYCAKIFKHSHRLKEHLVVHTDARPYKCKVCNITYKQWRAREDHFFREHTTKFKCTYCPKTCGNNYRLQVHERTHSNEKTYHCNECNTWYKTRSGLSNHINRTHTVNFPCSICNKMFGSNTELNKHSKTHSNERPFRCDWEHCDKAFKEKATLSKHIKFVHKKIKNYECKQCGKKFAKNWDCSKHINNVHLKLRPFKCNECGKGYVSNYNLNSHINSVHKQLRPFKCDQCDKCYKGNSALRGHINSVHKKLKPFKCSECDKGFYRNADLTRHKRVHTGERPYECGKCLKRFKSTSTRNRHQREVCKNL